MSEPGPRVKARHLGTGVVLVLALATAVVLGGERAGWWRERCLVLAAVEDPGELSEGSPVYFRGVEIGKVVMIRPPEEGIPGYKLRMAVDRIAFKHIPLDARVRVDTGKLDQPWQVTILPGREKPDWNFPGLVKVLKEVTDTEETIRLIRDLIDGLS